MAQKEGSVWIFGDSAGIDFNLLSNPIPVFSGMDDRGSCSSIADSNGILLFYCFSTIKTVDSATYVYNSVHDTMSNGDRLIGSALQNQVLIIPMPNDLNKYYVFHCGFYNALGLFYSIVDISLNGGLGEVIQKNIQINNLLLGDCLTVIKHGNGRDSWLITKLGGNGSSQINRYFVYLLLPLNNISSPVIQDFGNAIDAVQQRIVVNSDASKFMNFNIGGYMSEYHFNRCTGIISNPNTIFQQQFSNFDRIFNQGAYSPNDSVFYISRNTFGGNFGNRNYLLQYDLSSANIPLSCDTLDSAYTYPPVDNGALRLAPDGKIYYSQAYISSTTLSVPYADSMRNYINENLGVINNPDIVGAGCNFSPFSFYLGGKRTYYALPNNPNYKLGRLIGSPCDTLTSISNVEFNNSTPELFAYYHATWQTLFVNGKNIKGRNCMLEIFDVSGKQLFSLRRKTQTPYFTQDVKLNNLSAGIYLVSLQTEKEKLTVKFVKEN